MWSLAPIRFSFPAGTEHTITEALWELLFNLARTAAAARSLASWLCWCLWTSRNDKVFNQKTEHVVDLINRAIKLREEWLEACSQNEAQKDNRHVDSTALDPAIQKLILPLELLQDSYVCATDGSWIAREQESGQGCAVWNPSGQLLRLHQWKGNPTDSPLQAEAYVIRSALYDLMNRGVERVFLFSDNKLIIEALQNKTTSVSIEAVLDDILCIASLFAFCSFMFIPRCLNGVADELARSARSSSSPLGL